MTVRVLPRRGGKTTELVRLAAAEWLYIVSVTQAEGHRLYREAADAGISIPYPITWDDFVSRRYGAQGIKGFLIDNLDMCVQSITTVPVRAATLTGEQAPLGREAIIARLACAFGPLDAEGSPAARASFDANVRRALTYEQIADVLAR